MVIICGAREWATAAQPGLAVPPRRYKEGVQGVVHGVSRARVAAEGASQARAGTGEVARQARLGLWVWPRCDIKRG